MESGRKRSGGQSRGRERGEPKEARQHGNIVSCSLGTFSAGVQGLIFFGGCPWGPQIMLVDDRACPVGKSGQGDVSLTPPPTPVDLELEWVLGKMPQKVCGQGEGVCFPVTVLSQ